MNFRKCNCSSARLTSDGDYNFKSPNWARNEVVSGTVLICMRIQSKVVPNMMLGMHYNNRDVSPFYPFDVFVMDETCMYNCPTFFLFWKCLDDMSC